MLGYLHLRLINITIRSPEDLQAPEHLYTPGNSVEIKITYFETLRILIAMKNKVAKKFVLLPLILIIGLSFPTTRAKADMGIAPPSMRFSIEYQIPETDIIDGDLLVCEDVECKTYTIFETIDHYSYVMPNFYCGGENNSEWCFAGIGDSHFQKYHRISLVFKDGVTRVSNVFKKWGYSSYYKVVVGEVDLTVKEDAAANLSPFNFFMRLQACSFIPAAILTLGIESFTAKLYSRRIKKPIRHVITANLISLPIVWFIIPGWLHIKFLWLFIVVELFAILFEAIFILFTNQASGFTFKNGLVTSTILNLTSLGAGLVLVATLGLILIGIYQNLISLGTAFALVVILGLILFGFYQYLKKPREGEY